MNQDSMAATLAGQRPEDAADFAALPSCGPWDVLGAALSSPKRQRALIGSLRFAPGPPPQLRRSVAAGAVRSWIMRWLAEAKLASSPDHINLALHLRMAGLSRDELLNVLRVLLSQDPRCAAVLCDLLDAATAARLMFWTARAVLASGRLHGTPKSAGAAIRLVSPAGSADDEALDRDLLRS